MLLHQLVEFYLPMDGALTYQGFWHKVLKPLVGAATSGRPSGLQRCSGKRSGCATIAIM